MGSPIQADSYVHVVLTRDAAGTVAGDVNGARQQFSLDDTDELAVVDANDTLLFFRDDLTTRTEYSGGAVAGIRLYDGPLSADEVARLAAELVPATEPSVDETVPATDPPATPPDTAELRRGGEVIVFQSLGAGAGWDLAAQDPETGEVRKLVATDGIVDCADAARCSNFVRAAEWSADGRWVAFSVSSTNLDGAALGPCVETIGVWVESALGDPRQLTTPCDAQPTSLPQSDSHFEELWTWSPVGARLAYARVDGEMDELFVVDPLDGSQTSLGTVVGQLTELEWSPDGTRIAYSDGGSVYQVEVDGGKRSLLSDSFDDIIEIAWSPDGSQILVHDQGRYRIQVMNADGSDLHPVLQGEDACCQTEWSPQGDRILYMLSVVRTGQPQTGLFDSEVWTVSPDGSNPIKIFDSNGCNMGVGEVITGDALPVWAPNGTQVGYYACGDWVVANADGTGEAEPIGGFAAVDLFVPLMHRSWAGGGLSQGDLALIGQVDH